LNKSSHIHPLLVQERNMFDSDDDGGTLDGDDRSPIDQVADFYNLLMSQAERYYAEAEIHADDEDDEDGEGAFESLLRHAQEIEAGLMPGWKLDRSQPGALLWTTPSGRQYRSTLDGSTYEPYRH
jgi:hypothetical protein